LPLLARQGDAAVRRGRGQQQRGGLDDSAMNVNGSSSFSPMINLAIAQSFDSSAGATFTKLHKSLLTLKEKGNILHQEFGMPIGCSFSISQTGKIKLKIGWLKTVKANIPCEKNILNNQKGNREVMQKIEIVIVVLCNLNNNQGCP
jgi:hypothetical protein